MEAYKDEIVPYSYCLSKSLICKVDNSRSSRCSKCIRSSQEYNMVGLTLTRVY